MSIKKLIIQTVCDTCEDKIIGNCVHLDNKDTCIYCDRKANMAIKQIISEIVGELEKIPTKLRKLKEVDAQYNYELVLSKSDVVETIKKMGEV